MKKPALPDDEPERLARLRQYRVLDTLPEQALDDLTELASTIAGVPIALISLVDEDRQWFKSRVGLDATETPRAVSFCGHVVALGTRLEVSDARQDERFADNPLVTGSPNVVFYAGEPLSDADGYVMGTLCVIDNEPRELTAEQRRALAALSRQVMAQLELRTRLLDQAEELEARRELARLKDTFVSTVSHELRTPLTAMQGALRLLASGKMGEVSGRVGEMLQIAARNTDRLITLVGDLLDLEKLSVGALPLRMVEVELGPICQEVIALHEQSAEQLSIELTLEDADKVTAVGDPGRIQQVVTNFVSNALKFSPAGTSVTVVVHKQDGSPRVEVSDQGAGVPAPFRPHVFEPFSQSADEASTGRGSGLGLSISKAIIEAHGGEIGFDDVPDGGARFFFTLPA